MNAYTAKSDQERYSFKAADERAARDWIVNHLDSSQAWTLYPGTHYMNPHTGTVQTLEDWAADGYSLANAELLPVVQDSAGDWVEK